MQDTTLSPIQQLYLKRLDRLAWIVYTFDPSEFEGKSWMAIGHVLVNTRAMCLQLGCPIQVASEIIERRKLGHQAKRL